MIPYDFLSVGALVTSQVCVTGLSKFAGFCSALTVFQDFFQNMIQH